jgi:ParB family chromosome partitioning protein
MSTLEAPAGVTMIQATLIVAGSNDRQTFDTAGLEELAASIRAHGLAQPPTVRPMRDGRFEIVAGERRCRAMRDVLGWLELPCLVRDLDDETAAAIMLIENVQRADLDPLEEGRAYQSRMVRFGQSPAEVAALACVPVRRVRQRVELLSLVDEIGLMVANRQLPMAYAQPMCSLDVNRQRIALRAYQSAPMSREAFAAVCSRLQAEQDQEVMFDADSFLQVEQFVADATSHLVDNRSTVDEVDADPVGVADIADRLGVKAQTVAQWKLRGLLPAPRWTVSGMAVWQWADVADWARSTGRLK